MNNKKYVEVKAVPMMVGFSEEDVYHMIILGHIQCVTKEGRILVDLFELREIMKEWMRSIYQVN